MLPRRIESVTTALGDVDVKVVVRPDGTESVEPEFEDVAKIARDKGLPFHEVRAAAMRAWRDR